MTSHPFWNSLPTLLWILFLSGLLWLLRSEARGLLHVVLARLRQGTSVKFGALELGAVIALPSRLEKAEQGPTVRADEDGRREREREEYYESARRVMLVHKIFPSTEAGELYDILIYAVPSYRGTLASVQHVDYYFGGHGWKYRIFRASDRSRGFPVLTAAYGPFLCTAEVFFTDGESVMLHRFIDFEMGHTIAPIPEVANEALQRPGARDARPGR